MSLDQSRTDREQQQENNISNFFAAKIQEQQDDGIRKPINRNVQSIYTERDQQEANISNFFQKKLEEHPDHGNRPTHKTSVSPVRKFKGDPRSAYSRKDITEREREQLFLQYYDDTLKLRTNQTKLEQHIKELKTKLRVIEGEYVYSKKKFQGDEIVKEDLAFIDDLKRENLLLKNQLKDNMLPKAQMPSKGLKQKTVVRSTPMKSVGVASKASPDHIRLIDQLKIQLKKAEQQIQALHAQQNMRGSVAVPQGDFHHDKNVKIATLQHRFESLDGAFSSQKGQLEKTRQLMEDVNKQLYEEKAKNAQLEVQLRASGMAAATAKDLQLQVDELEREKKMLEAKYKDIVESPFFKDLGEKAANPARLREAENQLTELKGQLKSVHDKNTANEKEVIDLKSQLKVLTIEKEKLKDEKTRMEAILQERERTQGFMDKQMEMFNMSNDREKDNFIKALGMVKLKGEEPAWKRLEFIDRHEQLDITNPTSLLREIDRLRLEKSEIAAQLEKAQTLLQTHLEMEKEKEIINNAELSKLHLQLKSSNNRIEELVKLADFRARTYKDNMLKTGLNYKAYDEGASEFSDITESEISTNENTLDVLVRDCELDELVLRKLLSGKVMDLDGLQTMVALDFYNHDTQNSEITEGLKPNYNFQVAYKVNVDEELVTYMENEFMRAEIYAVIGSDLTLIGTCYTSYRELIIKNYDAQYGTSAVVNLNSIVYGERKSDIIGVLKLKMRMRHPMSDALHWLKERGEFMRENQETLDIKMDPTLKSRKLIVQVDKISGLDKKAASFVYYKLYNLRDNCTPTVPGQEPVFNYISTHDLLQNEAVKKYLEKESLEFVVFDDSAPLRRGDSRTAAAALDGMVGRGRVKLNALLLNEPIDQVINIQNLRGGRVATLHVRMYWYDQNQAPGFANDTTNLTQIWEENMTRNIVSAWKLKGQNLDSAFSIIDSDGDGRLSFEEFREGVLRTFKVKAKEDEIGLYWRRLHLVHEHLPKDEFFMKFGPYFSGEENMRVTYNKLGGLGGDNEYRDKISQINQMLNKNSENLNTQVSVNQEIVNVMCKRLAQNIKQYNLPIDFYLAKFDRDSSGNISKPEMRAALASLDISLTEKEIDDLLRYFDVNQDGRISVDEFKTLVKGGIADELRKLRTQESFRSQSIGPEAREEVVKFIADHINKSKKTIQQFTKGLDADGSGSISRAEFSKFFQGIGMTIQKRELDALFEELDPKNTDKVDLKRFNEIVGRYLKEKPVVTVGIEKTLGALGAHIKEKNMDAHAYFNKIDKDNSGFLERRELKAELQGIGIVNSDIELENLLNYFDNSGDGRISSKEFVNAIQPYIQLARTQSTRQIKEVPNNKVVNDLKGKCHDIVRKNYQNLISSMAIFKENSSGSPLITKDNFRKVLLQFNVGFLPSEIDLVLQYLVETNADDQVYYEKFLNSYNDSTMKNVDFAESRTFSSTGGFGDRSYKRLSSAEEIFARINKVLKENRISLKEAFGIFDKDGNGKISLQEFRDAFAGMKLNLTKQEVEDVIRHIDKSSDGQIDYKEFIAAMKQ